MPNFIAFGQNDRITIEATRFAKVGGAQTNEAGFHTNSPICIEFYNEIGDIVAVLQEYQYGSVVREDALRPNM